MFTPVDFYLVKSKKSGQFFSQQEIMWENCYIDCEYHQSHEFDTLDDIKNALAASMFVNHSRSDLEIHKMRRVTSVHKQDIFDL